MKNDYLLESLNSVDDQIVEQAADYRPARKRIAAWLIPAAAVFALALVLALVIGKVGHRDGEQTANEGGPVGTAPVETHTAYGPASIQLLHSSGGFDSNIVLSYKRDVAAARGEEVDLTYQYDVPDNTQVEWVPFFKYDGRLYWSAFGELDQAAYLGERVLTVKEVYHRLPSEYNDGEGVFRGEVYAVNGFDPSFMLCRKNPYYEGELVVYICDNGYSVAYGADVIEERFHVGERLESIIYEDMESEKHAYGIRHSLAAQSEAATAFMQAIDDGAWCVPYETEEELEALANGDHWLVWLDLGDFSVRLSILDGRYAYILGSFGGYFIELDEAKLRSFLEAMENGEGEPVENTAQLRGMKLEDAVLEPTYGRFIPDYIPDGVRFEYCIGKYDVERKTGRTIGIKRLDLSYEYAPGSQVIGYINMYIGDLEAVYAMQEYEDPSRRCDVRLEELTADSFVSQTDDPEYHIWRAVVYSGEVSIDITAENVDREELVKFIRSCFD